MIRTAETPSGWTVGLGPFAGDEETTAIVPSVPWDTSPPHGTPLHVLCWRSRHVPLTGRDGDRQALLAWARSGPGARARLLVGDPGSGKTRLAAEVADMLQQEGWSAGFVCWSQRQRWRVGKAGALLILDDPFDAEGPCWDEIRRVIRDTVIDAAPLRLLVLSRDRWRVHLPRSRNIEADDGCSFQDLDRLSAEDAAILHNKALARYAPERPAPRPEQTFEEWAASEPSVRCRPLYAIASALSLGHPPWDEGYAASSRRSIVGLVQATHNVLNDAGERAGLAAGVAPLVAAIAEVRGGLDETDLRALAARTALTWADTETFVECVQRLPAWSDGRLHACGDSLPQAEFVRIEFGEALERGLGVRIGAAMRTASLWQVARLDRQLSDADVSADVCDRLARTMRLEEDGWLARCDLAPRAGSLVGRLALHAAERLAPSLPVLVADTSTNDWHAEQLTTLARQQRREYGPAAAVDAAEVVVTLYRHEAKKSDVYQADLVDALRRLGDHLRDARSGRAGDVWKECVALARTSPGESDLTLALQTLGECEWATDEDRLAAFREMAEIHRTAGRAIDLALTLDHMALLAPLDEAALFVHEAVRIRAGLGAAGLSSPNVAVLDGLFARFKASNTRAAVAVARQQVATDRSPEGLANHSLPALSRRAVHLENVAAVAGVAEAREVLQEALTLHRMVWERLGRRSGLIETRLRNVEERLRVLNASGGV